MFLMLSFYVKCVTVFTGEIMVILAPPRSQTHHNLSRPLGVSRTSVQDLLHSNFLICFSAELCMCVCTLLCACALSFLSPGGRGAGRPLRNGAGGISRQGYFTHR
ncbi:hypothetical protein GBAR_LOCUS22635, partial [Geodia barretti]